MNADTNADRVAVVFNPGVWRQYNPVDQRLVVDTLADRMAAEMDLFARELNAAQQAAKQTGSVPSDVSQTLWRREHEVSVWGYAIAALGWYVSEMERWEKLRADFHALGQVIDMRIE